MATSLSVALTLKIAHDYTNALDLSTPKDDFDLTLSDTLANGTGVDQVNQPWHDQRSLAATSETLDLTSGLTDPLGVALAFTGIKVIVIKNLSTTAAYNLTVGNAATNAWSGWVGSSTHTRVIGPDTVDMWWSPGAASTVDATHKNLKIDAGANNITYDITIYGTKA